MNVSIYSENRWGIYFSLPETVTWTTKKITLHWIKSIIWNTKCIFPKLNAVLILKTAVWTTKNITTDNSVTNTWSIQQTPIFHGCTITRWTSQFKMLSLENFWRHGATPRFCLHVVNILIIEILSQTHCYVMWYINVIFIKFIKVTTYEIVLISKFSTVFSFMRYLIYEMWRDVTHILTSLKTECQRYRKGHLEIQKIKIKDANIFNTVEFCIKKNQWLNP